MEDNHAHRRIAAFIGLGGGSQRETAVGIGQYLQHRPDWRLQMITGYDPLMLTFAPDGAILAAPPQGFVSQLLERGIPCVVTDGYPSAAGVCQIRSDNDRIGAMAAEHLLERGLWNFGFAGWPETTYSIQRREGFCRRLKQAGFEVSCFEQFREEQSLVSWSFADHQPQAVAWIRSIPTPMGILACNDQCAMYITDLCHQTHLRVPEDVALIGVDNNVPFCELTNPPLSTVMCDFRRGGFEAARQLDTMMASRQTHPVELLIPPLGVVARRSTQMLAIRDPDVVAAIHFIRDHAHQPISPEDVLENATVSRRCLERKLYEALGRGIAAEIRRVHVARAKMLLATTMLSMPEVAAQSGFPNANRLYHVFHREAGCTPTTYRQQSKPPSGLA